MILNRVVRLCRTLPRHALGSALTLAVALQGCVLDAHIGRWGNESIDSDASSTRQEPDASAPEDVGVPADTGCSSDAATRVPCTLDAGEFASEVLTVTAGATTSYFANGATLPAGEYRMSYEDGCWKSGVVAWTVNLGPEGYFVVGGNADEPLAMAPGTEGTFAGLGAFGSYEECVRVNSGQPSVTFNFAGGRLGLRLQSTAEDLLIMRFLLLEGGETQGGRSPTFRLTCIGSCR